MALGGNLKKEKLMPEASSIVPEIKISNIENAKLLAIDKAFSSIEFNIDGTIISANTNFLNLFGYELNEIKGKHHRIFCTKEYADSNEYKEFWKTLNSGKFTTGIFNRKSKTGKEVWIQGSYSPIFDEKGKVFGVIKYAQDITEQKRLEQISQKVTQEILAQEEDIRQSLGIMQANQEEMLKKEAELMGLNNAINTSFASIEFDTNGNIITANDNFLKSLGYKNLSEIIGKNHQLFCDSTYLASQDYINFWNDLKEAKTKSGQFLVKHKDGTNVWLQATFNPIFSNDGTINRILEIAFDITEQKKQAEELQKMDSLKAQEEANQKIFEEIKTYENELLAKSKESEVLKAELDARISAVNSAAIFSEADLFGTITYANDMLAEISGFTIEEMIGKPHSIFRHPDNPKSLYKEMWETIKSGKIFKATYPNKRKDGSDYWVDATITPVLDKNGVPYKYISVRLDVTKQMENKFEMEVKQAEVSGIINAVNSSFASIEFEPNGTIITANDLFLKTMDYTLEQIQGKHHRIFCDSDLIASKEYITFWDDLKNGVTSKGDYKRLSSKGKEVWLSAAYTPVFSKDGKVIKVLKIATDITAFRVGFQAASFFINDLKSGNFNTSMDLKGITMNGDIANVTSDLNDLRNVLDNITNEVNRVVNLAGKEGQLRERMVIKNLSGSWKDLGNSLNVLLTSISEPVLEINRIVTMMAQGDLTQSFKMQANGDIMEMANALNIAIKNISNLLKEIDKSALIVANSSSEMTKRSEGMKRSTTEVSSSIMQMAQGAQEQAMKTDEASKLVEMILKSSNDMGEKSDIINSSANSGQQSCQNGLKIIKQVVDNMVGISTSADITSTSIDVLTNRSDEISRFLSVITDIASQTNLLALNAAIEAARAGDAGRGFAVVAEEIRKLAEDSRRSAIDIDKVIKDVHKDILSANKAIDKMKNSVENGSSASKEAESVFQEIFQSSTNTLSLSKEILDATKIQKDSIGNVVKNIEKIVVVSEEVAAGTQEIASSSMELNKSMGEITKSSENLATVANELKKGVERFQLN